MYKIINTLLNNLSLQVSHTIFICLGIDNVRVETTSSLTRVDLHIDRVVPERLKFLEDKLSICCHLILQFYNQTKAVKVNPYLTNGFSHRYQLGKSTFIFRGVRSDFYFFFISIFDEISLCKQNSP